MTGKQLLAAANRYYLRRELPHGIISWRYLHPFPTEQILIHRKLWLNGRDKRIPLPFYLFMELLLWLRWVLFAGWRRSWLVFCHRAAEVNTQEGVGRLYQLWQLFRLSICHCIQPSEVYAFGLYRQSSKKELLNYVFWQETRAFHSWRSSRSGNSLLSLELLQDKHALSELLSSHGVPMVPVLKLILRGVSFDPLPYLKSFPGLYCKPRHGSASQDNFVIEYSPETGSAAIFDVVNGMKKGSSSLDNLRKAMSRDDFLIQPLMTNHPLLAALVPSGDVVTLRIITENTELGLRCYTATLEIPQFEGDGNYCHTILPIEQSSGLIRPFPGERLPDQTRARHDAAAASLGTGVVPYWDEIKGSALSAHRLLPELFAIAWDFVLTPAGPCLLEGNSGWVATIPQMIHGGLLKEDHKES